MLPENWREVFERVPLQPRRSLEAGFDPRVLANSREIFEAGLVFGERLLSTPDKAGTFGITRKNSPRENQKKERKTLKKISDRLVRSLGIPNETSTRVAAVVIFGLGVIQAMENSRDQETNKRKTPPGIVTMSGLVNKYLPILLINTPEEKRRDLFLHLSWSSTRWSNDLWLVYNSGATAVARLILALEAIGAEVFLLPVAYDMFWAGDLAAVFHGELFYIQVKGSKKIRWQIVFSSGGENQEELWEGCQRFLKDTGLPACPLFVEVGLGGYRPETLSCKRVEEGVGSFLKTLFEPKD